jgi:CRISPR-associated protein (TIGR02710 family)
MKNALVLSVGGSPEPLIKIIKSLNPDLVYFLHTRETIQMTKEIINETGDSIEYCFEQLTNSDDLEEAFLKSRIIMGNLKEKDYVINVDFTGGTKTMVAGLVLATVKEDCNYTYIGASSTIGRDKDGVGTVKNGFEEIKKQFDPFETYAVFEFDNGKRFFNKYQFEASDENFKLAENKLEDEYLKDLTEVYIKIVNFYDTWDRFNTKIGKKSPLNHYLEVEIKKIIDDNPKIKKHFIEKEPTFYNQICDNIKFLNKKISSYDKNIKNDINYYLPDLLNNSYRRIEEGKYDDAIARLYRCIELIAQLNLNKIGLINENSLKVNKTFLIDKKSFNNKADFETYNIVDRMNPVNWNNQKKKSFGLTLTNSYELLKCLHIEIGNEYLEDKDLRNKIKKRNESILAHGLNSIDKKSAIELYEKVLEYAKETCPQLEEYLSLSKFPKFKL